MTRNLSATEDYTRATFLLEMALDRARMKQHFATFLLAERTKRGNGDPRRFPQPEMARLLDVSLRQYQRWEDPESPILPYWRNMDDIATKLDASVGDLFGSDEVTAEELDAAAANGRAEDASMAERVEALEDAREEAREWHLRTDATLAELLRRTPAVLGEPQEEDG